MMMKNSKTNPDDDLL